MTPDPAALDPRLRSLIAGEPEREIGVLLRTTHELTGRDRACLEERGLLIGSVIGTIVTGRIRAEEVEKLAALPFVSYVEHAPQIPVPRPPELRPDRTPPSEPR